MLIGTISPDSNSKERAGDLPPEAIDRRGAGALTDMRRTGVSAPEARADPGSEPWHEM